MSTIDSGSQRSFAGSEPSLVPEGGVPIDELSGEKFHAHVRYASEDFDSFQEMSLRSVSEHIPESANYVSTGIYFLNEDQEDRVHERVPPKEIQNKCLDDGRVLCSVIAETDDLEDGKTVRECIEALEAFAEEWLGISEYGLYHSGNRSIHLETDRYVTVEGLPRLKEEAEQFNQYSEVKLDTSVYDPNSVFRIEGAEHRKTGLYKREIPSDSDRSDITRRITDQISLVESPIRLRKRPSMISRLPRNTSKNPISITIDGTDRFRSIPTILHPLTAILQHHNHIVVQEM
ncbi:hypothetical protein QA600_08545 [Natronococcus sp. A-GB1]|uniref:hypothetical protein n=1 Tax=Natronococcus sp. A-GB1 TaxID=3037648 RepID=UPI00241EFB77|nr:hypothetical protein [Natronococcus sp. A-GB1]MDG5759389.1 hypothetical protein [Natronococcus sp. A-GB1]